MEEDAGHWAYESYSNLQHMVDTPMGRTVLQGLRKKNADVRFLCADVCSAAVQEGSQMFQTKVLSKILKESRFHSRLAASLPKLKLISLPVQVRKQILYRKFSFLAALTLLTMLALLSSVLWCNTDRLGFSGFRCGAAKCLVCVVGEASPNTETHGLRDHGS